MIFRAIWPIADERVGYEALVSQAADDLPILFGQASARPTGPGRFSIARSVDVPGSGRTTAAVLVFEGPAVALARRGYRKGAA